MKTFGRIVLSTLKLLSMAILMLVLVAITQGIIGSIKKYIGDPLTYQFIKVACPFVVLFATILFACKVYKHSKDSYGFDDNYSKNIKHLIIGAVLGLIMSLMVNVLQSFGGYLSIAENKNFNVLSFFISFLFVFAQAFSEEVVFRAFPITEFKKFNNRYITALGVIITSIVFALFHNATPGYSFLAFCVYFLFSVGLSMLYLTTKNIWIPVGFHILWNFSIFSIIGVGKNSSESIFISTENVHHIQKILGHSIDYYTMGHILTLIGIIPLFILGVAIYFKKNTIQEIQKIS
ncbi:CPBP family intramembrane glutamic endopeptidase [Bacillus paramycoides]|uniref:CPBP family intramembrane glutamic endopeptidase n=1 Tax=Bacillus paramycoides TaxID=2026194 RepID=UPI003CFE3582